MTDNIGPKSEETGPKGRSRGKTTPASTGADQQATKRAKKAKQQARGRAKTPDLTILEIAPAATPARMRKRHWGLVFSFLLMVFLPLAGAGWYLWERAVDQYASEFGFTVRQEGSQSAAEFIGGFAAQISGSSSQSDTDILFEFIQSQEMVARVDDKLGLIKSFSQHWEQDPLFSLKPSADFEDVVKFWDRIVGVSYDQSNRLMNLRVVAFDAQTAQDIANEILFQSQSLINELNAAARADTIRYAREDIAEAENRLSMAREALILFRTRTQSVDPLTDLQARMGVVNTLQQQLAEALITLDLLGENTSDSDPRVKQATRRVEVIRNRIEQERESVASGDANVEGDDYPTLLADYESLIVDREFAEAGYAVARTALDIARANASRQSTYLVAYVKPNLARTSQYPKRYILLGLTAFFLFFIWSIIILIYYSVRDSR